MAKKKKDRDERGRFAEGWEGGPGGPREGAGRKPNEFKELCRKLAGSDVFFKFAWAAICGKPVDPKLLRSGKVKMIPASVDSLAHLFEKLAAYGYDKPIQGVKHSGALEIDMLEAIARARKERGLNGKRG